jgi:2-iminobutanoate/2-iminopropanoate deaminase
MMSIERIPSDLGSFSESVVVGGPGRWIHVAGMVGFDADGKVTGDIATQTERTFDVIERILAKSGAGLDDVVKMSVFLTDLGEYGTFSEVRAKRFGDTLPVSAAVEVSGLLLGAAIEIEAVAFLGE